MEVVSARAIVTQADLPMEGGSTNATTENQMMDKLLYALPQGLKDRWAFLRGKVVAVKYRFLERTEEAQNRAEVAFFRQHEMVWQANRQWDRDDFVFVPRILSKLRAGSALYVLFDCTHLEGVLGEDSVRPSSSMPHVTNRGSIYAYVSSMWKAGSFSHHASPTARDKPWCVRLFPTAVMAQNGSTRPQEEQVIFVDYHSVVPFKNPQLKKALMDEALVVQGLVDSGEMGYVEALSRMAVFWRERAAKESRVSRLEILLRFVPSPEDRASDASKLWRRKLMTGNPRDISDLLRDRAMLELMEKTAPRIADMVAMGNLRGAEELARQMSEREGEIRRHGTIVDATDQVMEAFVSGDPEEAMEALADLKRKKIVFEAIPGLREALRRGDDEAARKKILEYRKRHKELDDELDRENDDDGGLLRRFSKARFGKTMRDGLAMLTDKERRTGWGGGSSEGGSWFSFRWFDFGPPDEQWVRRQH